jgi:hypothetical protein
MIFECHIVINVEDAYGFLCHFGHHHVYDNGQSLNYELHRILRNVVSVVWEEGNSVI